jgi:uncharacterized protein YfaS (alpha-2-macroglobulin family)
MGSGISIWEGQHPMTVLQVSHSQHGGTTRSSQRAQPIVPSPELQGLREGSASDKVKKYKTTKFHLHAK